MDKDEKILTDLTLMYWQVKQVIKEIRIKKLRLDSDARYICSYWYNLPFLCSENILPCHHDSLTISS